MSGRDFPLHYSQQLLRLCTCGRVSAGKWCVFCITAPAFDYEIMRRRGKESRVESRRTLMTTKKKKNQR